MKVCVGDDPSKHGFTLSLSRQCCPNPTGCMCVGVWLIYDCMNDLLDVLLFGCVGMYM